jgi:hypothetical protein
MPPQQYQHAFQAPPPSYTQQQYGQQSPPALPSRGAPTPGYNAPPLPQRAHAAPSLPPRTR